MRLGDIQRRGVAMTVPTRRSRRGAPAEFTGDGAPYPRFLRTGRNVEGQPMVVVYKGDASRAVIGDDVCVGSDVELLIGGNHRTDWVTTYGLREMFNLPTAYVGHPWSRGDILIDDEVEIGRGSRILSGVHIGKSAVVMPYSVVTRDVPAGTVVGGNPARPLTSASPRSVDTDFSGEAAVTRTRERLSPLIRRARTLIASTLRSSARLIDAKPVPALPRVVDSPIKPPPVTMGTASYFLPIVRSALDTGVHVNIGNYSSVSYDVECLFSGMEVQRGALSTQSPVSLRAADLDELPNDKICVGNDVWVARGARLLGGVSVGDGSVIAGYSVVVEDVRPYAIVAGNPAREIGRRFDDATVEALLRIQWWNWPHEQVTARWRELCSANLGDFIDRYDV